MSIFAVALMGVSGVRAEMMNARLKFDANDDIVQAGKSLCLKTTVAQTSGDTVVIDPSDCTALQPTGPKGRILPLGECVSGMVLTEMKELRFDFDIATPGDYETWIRARFPGAGYNHKERMDGGKLLWAWDSDQRSSLDHDRAEEGKSLEPHVWHWIRNYTYGLAAGHHVFHWPEPTAWCGGCELDRIVLIRRGSGIDPQDATAKNCRVVRTARAEVCSRPVRLVGIRAWQLDYAASTGGTATFASTTDDGKTWSPVESGKSYPVTRDGETLRIRLTLATNPGGGVPPIIYTHQLRVDRIAKAEAAQKAVPVAAAGIRPLRIVPNKIVYPVGEKGWADIAFTNASAKAERAPYVVTDSWDVDGSCREISRGEIELAPRAGKTVRVVWPGSSVRYGHEVKVKILGQGQGQGQGEGEGQEWTRSEYFAVNTDWWRVAQGCGLDTYYEKLTPLFRQFMEYYGLPVRPPKCTAGYRLWMDATKREGFGMGAFPGYQTLLTRWQMQLCSVGGNKAAADMPDGKTWYSCTEVTESRDSGRIREDTRVSHENGVHHTRYTIGSMEGPFGFEVARRHPEYLLHTDRGQPVGHYQGEKVDPVWISEIGNGRQCTWTYLKPDFSRDDSVEWAVRDLAAGIDGFGEDGVYWDGHYLSGVGYDSEGRLVSDPKDTVEWETRYRRTIGRWHELIMKDHPERFTWMNGVGLGVCNDRADPGILKRSGGLLEYQWSFLLSPSHPSNTYRAMRDGMRSMRDRLFRPFADGTTPSKIYFVGYLVPGWQSRPKDDPGQYREVWTMAQHVMSIIASMLGHPFAGGPQMRNFKQMMMRYSQFYWHEDIKILPDGGKHFRCDSLRDVWYDDMIYTHETKDRTDYYIHLVNVPESERCREDVTVDPPAVNDAVLSTKLFGAEGAKAWAIRPYAYLDPVLEPHRESVPVRSSGGETVIDVPPFRYYTLLVIRVPKGK